MPLPSVSIGDVVRWGNSRFLIADIQSGRAVLCAVKQVFDLRYRADVPVRFPDTILLGLTEGAVIRCKPRICSNLAGLVSVGTVSSSLMIRVRIAIEREMDARRIEAGIPKYLVV